MRRGVRRSAGRLASIAVVAAVLIAGCGLLEESPPVATPTPAISNVLIDPGFETSDPPAWRWVDELAPFVPTTEIARSGQRSAALTSDGANAAIVQTLNVSEIPEFFSGYYRVDEWPDDPLAYLEFTVRTAGDGLEPVRAVRFIIAGVSVEPQAPPPDVRYVFLSRGHPEIGKWTYFAYPLRDAFIARALAVPTGFASLDITLEMRTSDDGESEPTTAFFDDLYAGSQAGNPNRSKETRE